MNPKSGGAEKLNLQVLKSLIKRGDSVLWYAMSCKDLPKTSSLDGVKIIRSGNILTHYIRWPLYLWLGKFGKVDLIIDSIHGTGYLSSIFAPFTKKIILICEVAQDIWDEMYPFPVNVIGKVWERVMFGFYKKDTFWTISNSTRIDLVRFGIKDRKIKVVPMGFDAITIKRQEKYTEPTALFVGRLAEMKGIKDAIRAVGEVNRGVGPKWRLRIIGRGDRDFEKGLKDLAHDLNQDKYISFLGFVGEKEKFIQMAKAWVLLVPSTREGWGMIVPEANSVGTSVIAYNVSGLQDVVQKYAKENILIPPSSEKIFKELKKISRPIVVDNRPLPGWPDLNNFAIKNI